MPVITPPTTSQCCTRGCSSSHPLGGRFIFQPRSFELPALAALCSFSFALRRQVHPASPNNSNIIPSHNPDSCWRRNPTRTRFLTTHLYSLRCFGAWLRHMGVCWPCFRIASFLSWLGFAGVPCPPSSSAIGMCGSLGCSLAFTSRVRSHMMPSHTSTCAHSSLGRGVFFCAGSASGAPRQVYFVRHSSVMSHFPHLRHGCWRFRSYFDATPYQQ